MIPRLYLDPPLLSGNVVPLDQAQSHYLVHVLRLRPGATVHGFNGVEGEFQATLEAAGRQSCRLVVGDRIRAPQPESDLWLLLAPIKRDRIDYVVEKATELGVSRILPVLTSRTVVGRVNLERLAARAREAAEQCERLTVPEIAEPERLDTVTAAFPRERSLIVCDEGGTAPTLAGSLAGLPVPPPPLALLVGPEGGFARGELDAILKLPFARLVSLGPRVLRAETAALAALAVIQALVGDWHRSRSL
jgi:16S rRNA (uracil1498-N3)-methyltransferase